MGEFDFTYRLPQNFSRRVVQYLEQLESPNVARAFQNCIMKIWGLPIMLA